MRRYLWALLALLSIGAITWRFEPVVDLAWFLPEAKSPVEQVLLERLGQGPGSQLIFVSLDISSEMDPIEVSNAVATNMFNAGLFSRVLNGPIEPSPQEIPQVLREHRYLLSELPADDDAFREMLNERYADLAFAGVPWMGELISVDPTLASLEILQRLQPVSKGELQWFDETLNRAIIIAETRAPAFDIAGQIKVVSFLRSMDVSGVREIAVHGMGVYGADLQNTIRREATLRSLLATLAVFLILFAAYRRIMAVIYGFLPLLLGALTGLASITLLFGKVHGITLAFGFTLLGVAIDYPLHYLSHARRAAQPPADIWPTMRIGMLSTVTAFAAIALGGSKGLVQMGVFSAVGLLVAYLATRTLMPLLPLVAKAPPTVGAAAEVRLRFSVWMMVLMAATVLLLTFLQPKWTNDLSVVTPVAKERIVQDQHLREAFGAPDIRTVVVIRGKDEQSVLERTEALNMVLDEGSARSIVSGYQSVSALLPSRRTQQRRRAAAAAAAEQGELLDELAVERGFRSRAFDPFIADLLAVKDLPELDKSTYVGSLFERLIDTAFYKRNGSWVSTVSLFGVANLEDLRALLAERVPDALVVDLKSASELLMERYRASVLQMLMLAVAVIVIYLIVALRSSLQVVWVLGTLVAAQSITLLAGMLLLNVLSIFNLIAAVLVAGLGMDYALFFSRGDASLQGQRDTSHAVTICAVSTCGAFTILALSSIPVLQSMGVTVTAGVATSYLLARAGRRLI